MSCNAIWKRHHKLDWFKMMPLHLLCGTICRRKWPLVRRDMVSSRTSRTEFNQNPSAIRKKTEFFVYSIIRTYMLSGWVHLILKARAATKNIPGLSQLFIIYDPQINTSQPKQKIPEILLCCVILSNVNVSKVRAKL
jgi:hypothetical protein